MTNIIKLITQDSKLITHLSSVVQKNYHLSFVNYHFTNHETRNLEQNSEHFNHRTHRHCHHLRGDFLHGRLIGIKGVPLGAPFFASSKKIPSFPYPLGKESEKLCGCQYFLVFLPTTIALNE